MADLGFSSGNVIEETLKSLGFRSKIRLLQLYRRTQRYIDLLVDVQGHQMLSLGIFNGDPHPGNLLVLDDGKLGLIDFGQTKRITEEQRIGVARVISAIGNSCADDQIAKSMRELGFSTKFNKDSALAEYALLFFDSDIQGKEFGCATPQMYFARLNRIDPLVSVPDVASKWSLLFVRAVVSLLSRSFLMRFHSVVFVARSSFIIRGMGTVLGKQIRTSLRWKKQAGIALDAQAASGAIVAGS